MRQEISKSILNSTQPLNRQIIRIDDPHMRLNVYWIFLRSGGRDILRSERNRIMATDRMRRYSGISNRRRCRSKAPDILAAV